MAYQIYGNYYNDEPIESSGGELRASTDGDFNENKYYLNERFQQLLEKPITNTEEANERHVEISRHSQILVQEAKDIVKTIVDELDTGKCTYKPVAVGGVAGGQKYIVNQIFIKFPIDCVGLYGWDNIVAAKTAGHELKGLSALISCNIPNLHFPLVCVINYKGHCALVFSLVPLHSKSHVYGSADGGATFHNESYEISSMFKEAASKLNLQPHRISCSEEDIPGPVDLEGHLGADGRYYAVDFSRLLPAETPTSGVRGSFLFRLLRPEFVHSYAHALSSDAFSKLATNESDHAVVREATTHLYTVKIPKLADTLPTLLESIISTPFTEEGLGSLKTILHKHGINLRQLALILYHVREIHGRDHIASVMLVLEILSRAAKVVLIGIMRKEKSSDFLLVNCVKFLESIIVHELIDQEYQKQLEKQFSVQHSTQDINEKVTALLRESYLVDSMRKHKILLLKRISSMAGIMLEPAKLSELQEHLKQNKKPKLSPNFIAELVITSKHIHIVPIAEVLRLEGKFAEAHSFYKDELKLRKKVVGEDSLQVAITLTNLAGLYTDMGSSKDLIAERCLRKAMDIYQLRRPNSLELALAKERLALFYFKADKFEEAEPLLGGINKGSSSPRKSHRNCKYCGVFSLDSPRKERFDKRGYQLAIAYYEKAIKIKDKELKRDPLGLTKTLNNLGQTFCALHKWKEAQQLYNELYEKIKLHRGPMHSDCAIALDNLAKLYAQDPNKYDEAEKAYKEALEIKKASLGPEHVYTAITQDHLAQLLVKRGRYDEAEDLYKSALTTFRKKLGNLHSAVGIALHNISQLFARLSRYSGAREAEQEAVNIFLCTLGPAHHYTTSARLALDELNQKWGKSSTDTMLNHESMSMGGVSDEITGDQEKSKVVYTQFLKDVGAKTEDMDNSLLRTVLAVIQQVKTLDDSRSRISKSDSELNITPRRRRSQKHVDDSSIKSKSETRNPMKNPRSHSTKELISNTREQNRMMRMMQMGEHMFDFEDQMIRSRPRKPSAETDRETITKSPSSSFSSASTPPRLRRGISHGGFLPRMLSHIELPVGSPKHTDNNNENNNNNNSNNNPERTRVASLTGRSGGSKVRSSGAASSPTPSLHSSVSSPSLTSSTSTVPTVHPLYSYSDATPLPSTSLSSVPTVPVISHSPSTSTSSSTIPNPSACIPIPTSPVPPLGNSLPNSITNSLEFLQALAKSLPPRTIPTVPQCLLIKCSTNEAAVNWVAPMDIGEPPISYELEIKYNSQGWQQIYKGSNLMHLAQHLTPNTHYKFRLSAVNSHGRSDYATSESTTQSNQLFEDDKKKEKKDKFFLDDSDDDSSSDDSESDLTSEESDYIEDEDDIDLELEMELGIASRIGSNVQIKTGDKFDQVEEIVVPRRPEINPENVLSDVYLTQSQYQRVVMAIHGEVYLLPSSFSSPSCLSFSLDLQ